MADKVIRGKEWLTEYLVALPIVADPDCPHHHWGELECDCSCEAALHSMGELLEAYAAYFHEHQSQELLKKYQALVKWYDEHEGTPCEQIRHAQEIDRLRGALELFIKTRQAGCILNCN